MNLFQHILSNIKRLKFSTGCSMCSWAVTVQGAGQAGQAISAPVTYPMSQSFVAPGGTQ